MKAILLTTAILSGLAMAHQSTTATHRTGWQQQLAALSCAGQEATDGSGCAKQQGAG